MAWFRAIDVSEAQRARWDAADSGRLIRHLREERGWSLAYLARLAGTTTADLARFEAGATVPAQPSLVRYLKALADN